MISGGGARRSRDCRAFFCFSHCCPINSARSRDFIHHVFYEFLPLLCVSFLVKVFHAQQQAISQRLLVIARPYLLYHLFHNYPIIVCVFVKFFLFTWYLSHDEVFQFREVILPYAQTLLATEEQCSDHVVWQVYVYRAAVNVAMKRTNVEVVVVR